MILKTKVNSLEGNQLELLKTILEDNKLIINMPKGNNNEINSINCKIVIYLSEKYKIPIILNCPILSKEYNSENKSNQIIQETHKSIEENSKDNEKSTQLILADKFLIVDDDRKGVDIS